MTGRRAAWPLLVVCALLLALATPTGSGAQTLEVREVWYEVTANREEQVEFYAYSAGRLRGDPGDLGGVLISSCAWSSSEGFVDYCGDGMSYDPPFSDGQVFLCDSPGCTNLGTAQKYPCSLANEATYKGQGRIQPCRHIFDCDPVVHSLWGATQSAGCLESDGTEGTDPEPTTDPDCGAQNCVDSPILVDLDRGGIKLTDWPDGVVFDLDGDDELERVAWPVAGSGDGFLVLDRNGNGLVDSGLELFGNFTEQPPAEERHGFRALAVFDQPDRGGNGDGHIDPADEVFSRLRIWIDRDHDGFSGPAELHTLAELEVESIDLETVLSRSRDRHGNEFRYRSKVALANGVTQCVDVFLVHNDVGP